MIKPTFYHLSDAKRERVIRAILAEFAGSESDKVSINSIIKRAGISRGSFYQYFDDKVDLVEVVIKSLVDMGLEETFRAVSVSNGDIFYVYAKVFDIIADFWYDEEQRAVLSNLVQSMRVSDSLISTYITTRCRGFAEINDLYHSFSRTGLKFDSDSDMLALQQILNAILKPEIYKIYAEGIGIEEVRADYLRKLEIIRLGAEK